MAIGMSGTQEGSMDVLLSIKPEFAEKILDGEKQYEFRRTGFRDSELVDEVIMYASAPVQRIVGTFTIGDVFELRPELLWDRFGGESGIDGKARFMEYFEGKEQGYAFEIEETHRYAKPLDPKQSMGEFHPPMSFRYIEGELDNLLNLSKPMSL